LSGDIPMNDASTAGSRGRVVIERVSPEIDCGQFAVKRAVGDSVTVTADIFADGHDAISAVLQYWQHSTAGGAEDRREVDRLGPR